MRRILLLAALAASPTLLRAQISTLSLDDLTTRTFTTQNPHTAVEPRYVIIPADPAAPLTTAPLTPAQRAALVTDPAVALVLEDHTVRAHALTLRVASDANHRPGHAPLLRDDIAASGYNSPQGWAVRAAGGYGASIPGGPAVGPWNAGFGAGVRIAILDSGVDRSHPAIAPNLALNLSLVDPAALPSPCDDASPQDQQGHGTWVASLAAGALDRGPGATIGVAPQATLLNIKVLERLPAATGADLVTRCTAGEAAGMMSWVLLGIQAAIDNHADIIVLALGSLVDLYTGDGAGWKVALDRLTHAAADAGIVLIAATGNDGINLSGPRFLELPAQARDVLPITASTNPDCAENATPNSPCTPGPVTRASYANFGAPGAIAAPGGNLPNTGLASSGFIRGACTSGNTNTTDGAPTDINHSFACFDRGRTAYIDALGTSAAAPLAAGAAALLKAAHPTWTAPQILAALRAHAPASPQMTEPFIAP